MRATANGSVMNEPTSGIPKRTPLILLWAFGKAFWSIFTRPEKTFSARVLLFQPAWIIRSVYGDATWAQDLGLFLFLHTVYSYWTGASGLPSLESIAWLLHDEKASTIYIQIFSLLGVCGLFAGGIVFRGQSLGSDAQEDPIRQDRIDEQVLPPLLFTSKTTHSRLFPQKHAFTYSYLLVGVPVGMQGKVSKLLSIDSQRPGWFSVNSEDYLDRGYAHLTLAQKLQRYLHSQGVTDRDYAFSYLVTAPRFLGYNFNPVSFWYLYDSDTKLKYIILEVNNTFDERRVYLLRADKGDVDLGVGELDPPMNGSEHNGKQAYFTDSWQKDFHVSPFNSRKGSYSLRATDPLATYEETGHVQIDNTIVMRSSKDHPKIVARVFSNGEPKDPSRISPFEAVAFIFAWCWVGFATFPRIVWQASKLFFRRKLHVWYRPEVTPTSIGRPYTDDERNLEAFFRAFLTHAVSEGSKPLRVIYEPAHSENHEIVLYSPSFTYEEDHKRTLTIKILSPAFYSRFVHWTNAREAFQHECLATDERGRTAALERPELLEPLLEAIADQRQTKPENPIKRSSLEQKRWALLLSLRCPPPVASYASADPSKDVAIASSGRISELDWFVYSHCEDSATYRRIALKLFTVEQFAFGIPALLVLVDWLIRSALLLYSIRYADRAVRYIDVLRPADWGMEDVQGFGVTVMMANLVHFWSMLKG